MRNKRGISLIVLVITIIVMVILTGAVVMTLENTGITNQSKKAKNKTNYAQEITRLEVMKNGILTDNLGKITVAEYITELTNKGIIEGTVTDNADGFNNSSWFVAFWHTIESLVQSASTAETYSLAKAKNSSSAVFATGVLSSTGTVGVLSFSLFCMIK